MFKEGNIPKGGFETRFKKGHRGYKGNKNGFWRGDKAGYTAVHTWLKHNFGKADRCENKKCKYPRENKNGDILYFPKRFEWALKRGKTYIHKRSNFFRLCVSCHSIYDKKGYKK